MQSERVAAFRADVDSAAYPEPRHNIPMKPDEFAAFKAGLDG